MTYSLNYRQRVFKVKERDRLTYAETSKRFGVGMSTLFNWRQKLEPESGRSKPATKIDMVALRQDVEDYPDKYQYERAETFGVTQGAIGFALKRLRISYKKNAVSPQGGRSGTYQVPDTDTEV